MGTASDKEIKGAWVIHHGRKLVLDVNGPAEFPAINEAAKAATLLTKLGQANQATVTKLEARAIAVASGLDPRLELNGLLQVLERKRLIDQSKDAIALKQTEDSQGAGGMGVWGHGSDRLHPPCRRGSPAS